MKSQILNPAQLRALNNLGEIYCPGDNELPSFKSLRVIEHVDTLLEEIPPQDLADLKLLLNILGYTPVLFLKFLVSFIERFYEIGSPIGALLRMLRFGFRGLIFSLYYSGLQGQQGTISKTPDKIIGFEIQMRV